MPDEITAQIAKDLGIDSLGADEQKSLIAQFGEVALKAATMSVVSKLTPEQQMEFMKLAEAGDAAAIKTFLDAAVPNHEELAKAAVAEEMKRFKEFQAP
ncbi:MAG: DUF5663 domain-containing protein [Patescibacteria group bacterium]|mgnify:CR=1 FL=1